MSISICIAHNVQGKNIYKKASTTVMRGGYTFGILKMNNGYNLREVETGFNTLVCMDKIKDVKVFFTEYPQELFDRWVSKIEERKQNIYIYN